MDLSFNKYTEFMLSCNETYIVSCNWLMDKENFWSELFDKGK
jgi:hypothetical protein